MDAQLLTESKVRLLKGLGLQLRLNGRDQSIVYLGRHIAKADKAENNTHNLGALVLAASWGPALLKIRGSA